MTSPEDEKQTDAAVGEKAPSRAKGRRAAGAAAKAPGGSPRRKTRAPSTEAAAEPETVASSSDDGGPQAAAKSGAATKARSKPAAKASSKRATSAAGRGTRGRRRTARPAVEDAEAAEAAAPPVPQARPLPRMHAQLRDEIAPQLMKEFEYGSSMQVPGLAKIVVNIGLGEALENSRAIESATNHLALITGQRPVVKRARKSIAAFKLRKGQAIGLSVTLRGRRMYEFLDRLISSALPRIRDFNGLSREAFDGRGNYSIGIREQIIFSEIDYNAIDRIRGLQVAIVTTALTDREGFRLLELLGMPFARTPTEAVAA